MVKTEGVAAPRAQRGGTGAAAELTAGRHPWGPAPSPQTGGRAGRTVVGRLPLAVLGVRLVQVGEAGPQLQDAAQGRQVELAWHRDRAGAGAGGWGGPQRGSRQPRTPLGPLPDPLDLPAGHGERASQSEHGSGPSRKASPRGRAQGKRSTLCSHKPTDAPTSPRPPASPAQGPCPVQSPTGKRGGERPPEAGGRRSRGGRPASLVTQTRAWAQDEDARFQSPGREGDTGGRGRVGPAWTPERAGCAAPAARTGLQRTRSRGADEDSYVTCS